MEYLIQKTIIEKYGSINNFVDAHYNELPIGRTHIYMLVNYKIENPGVLTLEKLAKLIGLPKEDVINDYLAGYRNKQLEAEHSN